MDEIYEPISLVERRSLYYLSKLPITSPTGTNFEHASEYVNVESESKSKAVELAETSLEQSAVFPHSRRECVCVGGRADSTPETRSQRHAPHLSELLPIMPPAPTPVAAKRWALHRRLNESNGKANLTRSTWNASQRTATLHRAQRVLTFRRTHATPDNVPQYAKQLETWPYAGTETLFNQPA